MPDSRPRDRGIARSCRLHPGLSRAQTGYLCITTIAILLCSLQGLHIWEQGAVTLLALAPETGEIQYGVAPNELRAYAVRDAIGVVVETIAAVLDNGKILCSGLDIRRAASPAGAQVGNVVMVNLITLRLVVAGGVALVVVVDRGRGLPCALGRRDRDRDSRQELRCDLAWISASPPSLISQV